MAVMPTPLPCGTNAPGQTCTRISGKSLGHGHGSNPQARNAPIARGMCTPEVTSQMRLGTGGDSAATLRASCHVERDLSSISTYFDGTPTSTTRLANGTASRNYQPTPLETTKR